MCGYTGLRCAKCEIGRVAWFCGEDVDVGLIECDTCHHEYPIDEWTVRITVYNIEDERANQSHS